MYTVDWLKIYIYIWIEMDLVLNAYCDCLGIYIYVCGCGQDENCRLCLYEMQMWTCDCRLDWVYVTLKYDCVLVNWGVYWLYSLIDWRISMLLTDIWLKWDKLTVRTLRERTLCFEVTERWIEWNEGKIVSFYWDVCLVGVPRDHQFILHLWEH